MSFIKEIRTNWSNLHTLFHHRYLSELETTCKLENTDHAWLNLVRFFWMSKVLVGEHNMDLASWRFLICRKSNIIGESKEIVCKSHRSKQFLKYTHS